jgi:hypothetical protein
MAPLTLAQAALGLLAAVAATLLLHWLRGLPWSLAAIAGLAIGVLAIACLRTWIRLRPLWRDGP